MDSGAIVPQKMPGPLEGLSILIVEDEFLIAAEAQQMVENAGAVALGPVNSVAAARRLLAGASVDLVVLDLSLGNQQNGVLIDDLAARGIPFVVASGFDAQRTPVLRADRRRLAELLMKPYSETEFLGALAAAFARRGA